MDNDYVFEKLDERIGMFERDLERLDNLKEDSELNPTAIGDIAFVIEISMNALKQFRKELKEDLKQ